MKRFLFLLSIICAFSACKTPEARKPVNQKSGSFIEQSIERNRALSAKEEALIKQIIKQDTSNNYFTSKSGFWYYYVQKDTISQITPNFGDVVAFNYNAKDLYGNIIYTEKELDTITYTIDKEELFYGMREGLKLMKEGEIVTFIFPSYQAYGYYGDNDKIGTNIPLVTRVTLNKITKESKKDN